MQQLTSHSHSFTVAILLALMLTFVSCRDSVSDDLPREIDRWVAMWNSYDLNMVNELFLNSDQLTYFSSEKEGVITGFDEVVSHHEGFDFVPGGRSAQSRLWLEEVLITGSRENKVVTAIWFFSRPNGEVQQGPVTIVYTPVDGRYRILHMNFANYPMLDLPEIEDGYQARALTGNLIPTPEASPRVLEDISSAIDDLESDRENVSFHVWAGRHLGYAGRHREAIELYSDALLQFPANAELFRHRGHRFISIREFSRAIYDFEMGVLLTEGQPDITEPDGRPNPLNIPLTTLQGNIWYHLGLAHYLQGDYRNCIEAYTRRAELAQHDDNLVSLTHWIYMSHRLLGEEEQAAAALGRISSDMTIIENHDYHRLCLFYKGELSEEDLLEGTPGDAVLYGVANWHYYNGNRERATELLNRLIAEGSPFSFGYIAAERRLSVM